MEPYKLAIKFPDGSEFNAEGAESVVKDAFEQFLEARKTSPAKQQGPPAKASGDEAAAADWSRNEEQLRLHYWNDAI